MKIGLENCHHRKTGNLLLKHHVILEKGQIKKEKLNSYCLWSVTKSYVFLEFILPVVCYKIICFPWLEGLFKLNSQSIKKKDIGKHRRN